MARAWRPSDPDEVVPDSEEEFVHASTRLYSESVVPDSEGDIQTSSEEDSDPGPTPPSSTAVTQESHGGDPIYHALQETFGKAAFREDQEEIIRAVMAGHDVIAMLPTGYGKSLLYHLPASCTVAGQMTLVISPLKRLIEDQVYYLQSRHIDARYFIGSDSIDGIMSPRLPALLFTTPEKLQGRDIQESLRAANDSGALARIVLDEAHCLKTDHIWRESYALIAEQISAFKNVPITALSASLTEQMIVDLKADLNIPNCLVYTHPPTRPNLYYAVRDKALCDWRQDILEIIDKKLPDTGSGIIYCRTPHECDVMVKFLKKNNVTCGPYYRDMPPAEHIDVYKKWISLTYRILVATTALGLGIDNRNVGLVIHNGAPVNSDFSLLNYYQQAGRAGRDGKEGTRGYCYMYYALSDFYEILEKPRNQGAIMSPDRSSVVDYCRDRLVCRHALLRRYFDPADVVELPPSEKSPECCDNCQGSHYRPDSGRPQERWDVTHVARRLVQLLHMVQATNQSNITAGQLANLYLGNSPCEEWRHLNKLSNARRHLTPGVGHTFKEIKQIVEELIYTGVFEVRRHKTEGKNWRIFYVQVIGSHSPLPQIIIHAIAPAVEWIQGPEPDDF
ncbi:ATP-dependent DNA helicase sgs1 [Tulasnella sp. 331]|nr:ATP-dependent DNA helicase sgs1 [Tulasnella sp. 331]